MADQRGSHGGSMRIMTAALAAGLALLAATVSSGRTWAVELPSPEQIGPHTYTWIGPYGPPTRENGGFRMNLGFIVGEDAVAVVDSGYGPEMAESMVRHIRRITEQPIRYVINTNSQPHRIMGNPAFRKHGAEIIVAEAAVPRIIDSGAQFAGQIARVLDRSEAEIPLPERPDHALEEARSFDLGGDVHVEVIPVGDAHTAGSLIVEVHPDDIVFAGDVLYGGRLVALLPVSDLEGWIASYDRLRSYPQSKVFVPGHGEPGPLSSFEEPTYEYLVALRDHMAAAVRDWVGLREAIQSFDQSRWKHLANFDELAGPNAHQGYLELEAAGM